MNFSFRKSHFAETLLEWYDPARRPMPWKSEKNPYLVWLSEVILQQTRVEQGMPYYYRFINKYPTVEALANAPEDDVMKLWEGLGYYSRARNLHHSAKYITRQLNGIFPENYEGLLNLKGVGAYTAAAIASFAFGLPYAVVDGNVYRILSRIFGIQEAIDTPKGKKIFAALASELLDKENPGEYNQAIIDFGATQCIPKSPSCGQCPFNRLCHAYLNNCVGSFPLKIKNLKRKTRYFNYLVLNHNSSVVINKRVENDIWKNLYELPLIETDFLMPFEEIINCPDFKAFSLNNPKFLFISKPIVQNLTHQKIISRFLEFEVDSQVFNKNYAFKIVYRKELHKFAFSKNIDWYLKDKSLFLDTA